MLKIFIVHDSKALCYGNPMVLKSPGEAVRSFTEVANDPSTVIGKNPEDFTLFEIGEYDERLGDILVYEVKKSLGLALDFRK